MRPGIKTDDRKGGERLNCLEKSKVAVLAQDCKGFSQPVYGWTRLDFQEQTGSLEQIEVDIRGRTATNENNV